MERASLRRRAQELRDMGAQALLRARHQATRR
jgi:hypothetical protein